MWIVAVPLWVQLLDRAQAQAISTTPQLGIPCSAFKAIWLEFRLEPSVRLFRRGLTLAESPMLMKREWDLQMRRQFPAPIPSPPTGTGACTLRPHLSGPAAFSAFMRRTRL